MSFSYNESHDDAWQEKSDRSNRFLVEDAARSEAEVDASQETDRPFPRLGQELRLDNRWMDLRAPANNAIMRVQSMVCQLFRESLYSQGFIEIHTPKLIAGESESGAGVFTTDYFCELCLFPFEHHSWVVHLLYIHTNNISSDCPQVCSCKQYKFYFQVAYVFS